MMTGWQRTLRTSVLVLLACIVALLLAVRAGRLAVSGYVLFASLFALLASPTIFWWAWVDERLARSSATLRADTGKSEAKDQIGYGRGFRPLRVVLAVYAGAILLPIALLVLKHYFYDRLPVPMLMWVMAWHLSIAAAGMIGLPIWITYLILRGLRRVALPPSPDENGDDDVAPVEALTGLSRRSFLTGALAASPLIVSGSVVAGGLRQQGRFLVRRMEIQLPRLPARLRGLTITHVSDFHVGRFFRPEHLPRVVDAVSRLDSDLIAITGDIVDHSAEFFPPACEAIQQMTARCGRFIVVGNHDLIDSPTIARKYLRQFGTSFLEDERRPLDIGGERIQIVGLDWSRHDQRRLGLPGHEERVGQVMAGADPSVFTLALAHHPHAFDALANAGVDFTLAGHTHGGQIMLTPPGSPAPVGGGNLLFRYIWGEYRRGNSAMYVTSGVGNWFPVRINAPAEIVQIRLV